MTTNITLLSTKGGTGKTTLSAHLAGVLSALGEPVLLIDSDLRQPSLSSYFELEETTTEAGLQEFLTGQNWMSAVRQTKHKNLDIVVSNADPSDLEAYIERQPAGRLLLLKRLRSVEKKRHYKYVVIDSWGSVGAVTEMAALAGTDFLICPTLPEKLSALELLRNTLTLVESLAALADFGSVRLPPPRILFNAVPRTRDSREIMAFLKDEVGGSVRFLETVIPRKTAFNVAASARAPMHEVETAAEILRPNSATRAVADLLVELMPQLSKSFARVPVLSGLV